MTVLTCFGELLIDMLPNGSGGFDPIAGGAPANVAVGFRKLGGESRFIGGLSDDVFGQMLRKTVAEYQVDCQHLIAVPNSLTALAFVQLDAQGERRFSFYRHRTADLRFPPSELKAIQWPNNGIFHICSNTLTETDSAYTTLAMLVCARQNQQLISFDINLRLGLWNDVEELTDRIEQVFHFADVLKFSLEELEYMAASKAISNEDYLQWLFASFALSVVIVSNGGSAVQLHMRDFYREIPVPQINAVDTTGAGDSLVSGFFAKLSDISHQTQLAPTALLQDKHAVKEALKFAVLCGAFTCQSKGACPAMPTRKDIL
ncbi:carbohydrate kinase [Pseudoalteromonas fenneropenaei]|uniref:Carbohydrate kinase n=1 Tax=Pseudoalteromonas fenneropenaei TaxID=1737459 RepID=A0ABV7CJ59_9GAMM